MVSHYDHASNIGRYTMTTWTAWIDTIYGEPLWPHGQYGLIHNDHMDSMDWYNIWWANMTTWTVWIDTIYAEPLDHVSNIGRYTMTTWTAWIDTVYSETLDNVGNILWATLTTWKVWIDTIYGEPLWPRGHYELVRYMVTHDGHIGSMN